VYSLTKVSRRTTVQYGKHQIQKEDFLQTFLIKFNVQPPHPPQPPLLQLEPHLLPQVEEGVQLPPPHLFLQLPPDVTRNAVNTGQQYPRI
jgi:hypothetical protein